MRTYEHKVVAAFDALDRMLTAHREFAQGEADKERAKQREYLALYEAEKASSERGWVTFSVNKNMAAHHNVGAQYWEGLVSGMNSAQMFANDARLMAKPTDVLGNRTLGESVPEGADPNWHTEPV